MTTEVKDNNFGWSKSEKYKRKTASLFCCFVESIFRVSCTSEKDYSNR